MFEDEGSSKEIECKSAECKQEQQGGGEWKALCGT